MADRLGFGTAETAEALVDAGVDALVIATPTDSHAALLGLAARAGVPAFCEKPVALELAAIDAVIDEVERPGSSSRSASSGASTPGYRAARDAVHAGALGKLLVLRAATHDPAPPPEAYIATSGGIFRDLQVHDFDAIRFVTGEDVVEVYADGAVRETEWFERHDDVDTAVAVLRLSSGPLAILSGTRHDPLGYDVRLEVFGTADSIAVGVDERTPLRSVEPGRHRRAQPATATSSTASRRPTGTSSPPSSTRCIEAVRARAPSRTRAPRSRSRSPPTAREPSGARSRSRRWLASNRSRVRESTSRSSRPRNEREAMS